jgi:hypothetical protein
MVCFLCDPTMPAKRYEGQSYEVPANIATALQALADRRWEVRLAPEGKEAYITLDQAVFEPLKFEDPAFAGRLMEQTLKLAGILAITDNREEIGPSDIHLASAIRQNLYQRMRAMVQAERVAEDLPPTTKALHQLADYFARRKTKLKLSALKDWSRAYAGLHLYEQEQVRRALITEGHAVYTGKRRGALISARALKGKTE